VTIGGNLTVSGDQVTIGAAAQKMRIGKAAVGQGNISFNLGFDSATVDSGGNSAYAIQFPQSGAQPQLRAVNTAGNAQVMAIPKTLLTDYTLHQNTGSTTENTIYSKLIRANTLGANGGFIVRLQMSYGTQGGVATTVRIKFGATVLESDTAAAPAQKYMEFIFTNQNAVNNNRDLLRVMNTGTGAWSSANATDNIDTSVDQTLSVTSQSGAVGDITNFFTIEVEMFNDFGPV
jgi:hypothetical protein